MAVGTAAPPEDEEEEPVEALLAEALVVMLLLEVESFVVVDVELFVNLPVTEEEALPEVPVERGTDEVMVGAV